MQRLLDFFTGSIRAKVNCRYPERIINVCAANGIEFRDLERNDDGSVTMTLGIEGYGKLKKAAEKSGQFTVRPVKKKGAPFFLWRMRKRYALLIGMAFFVALVWISSLFIWQIDVSGNEKVEAAEILSQLRELGVDIGTCRLTLSQEYISNEMLQRIPELSWITVNTHGSRAEVKVREEISVPDIPEWNEPSMVTAAKSGIITKMTVHDGKKLLNTGDTVLAGETIVSGIMESKSSGTRGVHAGADVWARTWYTLSAKMPLAAAKKEYTGEKNEKTALIIGGRRINLYFSGGNEYSYYDKITKYDILKLPGGTVLPVTVIKETSSEYVPCPFEVSEDAAEQILKSRLTEDLEKMINGGSITSTEYEALTENGVITVTLKAECLEEIGVVREMTEEEKALISDKVRG